jgi:hypothetical protein
LALAARASGYSDGWPGSRPADFYASGRSHGLATAEQAAAATTKTFTAFRGFEWTSDRFGQRARKGDTVVAYSSPVWVSG